MSSYKSRKLLYWLCLLLGTVLVVSLEYRTNVVLVKDDPSVQEWFAFLPFLIPIYTTQVAVLVVPLAITTEAVLYCVSFFKKEKQRNE